MTCIRVSFLIWQRTKNLCRVLRLSYHICANNVRLLHSSSYFKWMPERKGSKSNIKNKENILCSEFYWGETLMWTFLAVLCVRIKLCKKQNKTLSNIIKFWASNLILSFKNLTSMLKKPNNNLYMKDRNTKLNFMNTYNLNASKLVISNFKPCILVFNH